MREKKRENLIEIDREKIKKSTREGRREKMLQGYVRLEKPVGYF